MSLATATEFSLSTLIFDRFFKWVYVFTGKLDCFRLILNTDYSSQDLETMRYNISEYY